MCTFKTWKKFRKPGKIFEKNEWQLCDIPEDYFEEITLNIMVFYHKTLKVSVIKRNIKLKYQH